MVFKNYSNKGHFASKKLSNIILCLFSTKRKGRLRLYVIHVASTTIRALEVDGLSRADNLVGLLALHEPKELVSLRWNTPEPFSGQCLEPPS